MSELHKITRGADKKPLYVALIGPDEQRRKAIADVLTAGPGVRLREFVALPPEISEFAASLAQKFHAVILDVDSDPEYAFRLVEALCADGHVYLMACSAQSDMKLAIRFMRAGVREFFTLPVDPAEVGAALNRAAERPASPPPMPLASLFVFLGVKGGVGVTTLSSNFALSLAQESEKRTLLVDLGLPLGDVAINLGLRTQYSVLNALANTDRLDANFLDTLVTRHSSGLAVLAAPDRFPDIQPAPEALDKLLAIARQSFDYVVVDAGSRAELIGTALFDQCTTIYLVTQVGITELRNAHRLITQFFATRGRSLQVILNRYTQRALLFDDAQIEKTLTRAADWKIPDDYAAARRTRNTATPLAMIESSLSEALRELARDAGGIVADTAKKGLFRLLR